MKDPNYPGILLLYVSLSCLLLSGCRKNAESANADPNSATSQAKIYAADDVDKELKEGEVVLGGTREDALAFFRAHPNYELCQDRDVFSVAVVRNTKVDKRADDIYIINNYGPDGKISSMEVGPPQFSVNNPASYCK